MGITFKDTKIGWIPDGWELLPFDDFVDKKGSKGKYQKLQTKDYLNEGQYPIVDQGQEFIAGYTNDENGVYTGSLPVTIFGDHTLIVKFVNMEFAIGADGTVPLYPNKNKLTDKFFYYLICNHKIKSEGYQRHLKYLKQKWLAIPPLPEQRKITDILSTVDETIEKTNAIIEETQQLKKGLMQRLFTKGIGHTRFKETKIGRIPEEWEVVRLDSVCIGKAEYGAGESAMEYENGLIRYVRITDINADGTLTNDAVGIPPEKANKYILKEGDFLFARSGSVGLSYLYDTRDGLCAFAGYLIKFEPRKEQLLPTFLKHYCQSAIYWKWVHSTARTTTQSNINAAEYSGLSITLPFLPEQHKIAEILSKVDAKIKTEQAFKEELERLKKGLMQVLLSGKVRVND